MAVPGLAVGEELPGATAVWYDGGGRGGGAVKAGITGVVMVKEAPPSADGIAEHGLLQWLSPERPGGRWRNAYAPFCTMSERRPVPSWMRSPAASLQFIGWGLFGVGLGTAGTMGAG